MTTTYTVAVKETPTALPVFAAEDGTWTELRGCISRLSSAAKDRAVAEVLAAGLPYDVIEHDGETQGGRRVGGTLAIVERL